MNIEVIGIHDIIIPLYTNEVVAPLWTGLFIRIIEIVQVTNSLAKSANLI